ncbi:MAG TPA: phosphoglycerate mutase family protein [Haliscomenobacter sp.]|uniref:SixA phosphatase family protein n=1 Tax=Haliscomenobacter sp. TaxID=2717303 RepID=UPI002BF6D230|nr:phosphoglycerate mutase family protein [Haliscomenobacter sp.]HOY18019.1 phosphoglycerate mutase family protein [Haliscomenobacter sp.]
MKKLVLYFTFLLIATVGFAQSTPSVIFIVRHCEKAMESTDNPNLAEEGKKRAAHLAEILKNTGIEAVYSTNYKRTMQTAEPLATVLKITPSAYEPREATFGEMLRKSGKKVLVVGHSNTVPDLLNQLTGTKNYQPYDGYGDLWVVTMVEGQETVVLRLSF